MRVARSDQERESEGVVQSDVPELAGGVLRLGKTAALERAAQAGEGRRGWAHEQMFA